MEKKMTSTLLQQLRIELNNAVLDVADRHGLSIRFGNATYQDLTATFKVEVSFAADGNFDPAKALWDQHCKLAGLEPEDFGKEFCFLGEKTPYRIAGYDPSKRRNNIIIHRVSDGKAFVTNAQDVRTCLGKTSVQQVEPPMSEAEKERKAKMDWDLNCWAVGMKPEDFGQTILYNGSFYKICGVRPKATKNTVLIRHTVTGKEYVAPHETVKTLLGGKS